MQNQQAVQNCGDECPKCGGTGFIAHKRVIEGYGEIDEMAPCPECAKKRRSFESTGIPAKFCEATLNQFDFGAYSNDMSGMKKVIESYLNKYKTCEKSNKGLYLWSKTPGSGKTYLSCCLARSIMLKYNLQMRFVTAPDYLAMVGESYNRQQGAEDISEIYRKCALLVLDDMGAQKSGEWQDQEIFRLINERLNNGKITIFTSNYPPEQLKVSDRTADRIVKCSLVFQMPEESIRRKEARQEQEAFLKELLA